ncbi:MAG TPA: hypothetical protein VKD91_20510 [Pyrinomonadaceae bacterium]|nr:hypothetical protein [Pyrinomonadaceae bacterium]
MAKPEEKAVTFVKKDPLAAAVLALLLIFCLTGAVWTAYWSLRYGLAPRPPLSPSQTVVRFVAVTAALWLWRLRRDWIERSALACAVIAAGSSGLYGLGFNSTTLQVVRLLFHFLAYSLGVIAIIRWFRAQRTPREASPKAAAA